MASSHDSPGPLIRLWGIKTAQLPTGAVVIGGAGAENLAPKNDDDKARSSDELAQFLGSLFREAVPFIDAVSPKSQNESSKPADGTKMRIWKAKGSKFYTTTPASIRKVKVDLFERVIKAGELKDLTASSAGDDMRTVRDETWICRRSLHQDMREPGTASWEEFRECFKEKHPEMEKLFTPSVIKMEKEVVWDCEDVPAQTIANETWSNFSLCIIEARHRVGKPLRDRTFPILQMTCSAVGVDSISADAAGGQAERSSREKREFLVISVTIPDYFESTFRKEYAKLGPKGGDDQKAQDTVIASYASIERIRQLDPTSSPPVTTGSQPAASSPSASPATVKEEQTHKSSSNNNHDRGEDKGKGEIEWLMALTSDAGGILPMFVQNLAVPGQIAKDVPLFLGWIAKERHKKP